MTPPMESKAPLGVVEIPTPVGPFSACVTLEDGLVRASGLGTVREIAKTLPEGLFRRGWEIRDLPSVTDAVSAWLDGDGAPLAQVPVRQVGGAFMQRVWQAMREIPRGEVMTYGELAADVGNPRAARAVGTACARNRLGLFVPCHRVVAATGIGQYGPGGSDIKRRLLDLEGAVVKP